MLQVEIGKNILKSPQLSPFCHCCWMHPASHSKFFCRSKVSVESLNMGHRCFCCSPAHLLHTNKTWSSVVISGLGNKVIAARKLFSNCSELAEERWSPRQFLLWAFWKPLFMCLVTFWGSIGATGRRSLPKAPSWQGSLTEEHRKSLSLLTRADVALKKRLVHAFDSKQSNNNYMWGIKFGNVAVLLILHRNINKELKEILGWNPVNL